MPVDHKANWYKGYGKLMGVDCLWKVNKLFVQTLLRLIMKMTHALERTCDGDS